MQGFETDATFFDGETAGSTKVRILINASGVRFTYKRKKIHWPMEELRGLVDQAMQQGIVLEREDDSTARLVIEDQNGVAYLKSLPNLLRARSISSKMKRRVAIWGGGAIGSVLLILFVIIPLMANTLANMLPVKREEALGRKVVDQIGWIIDKANGSGSLACSTPDGQDALDAMGARLSAHFDTEYTLNVQVFRSPEVNAFAAPGGYVVLFDGLLQEADTPEEVAGVLAHEFGHVVSRDPTRLALRSAASAGILSMLIGDFGGGFAAVIVAEQVVSAQYSQKAEAAADKFSHDVFHKAKLPSAEFGSFFTKLAGKYGDDDNGFLAYLSTHPDLKSRQEAALAADTVGGSSYEPVISKTQWDALRAMCAATRRDGIED